MMGMSTCIVGIKPPDGKWRQMKAIYDACDAAGVYVPAEVDNYFNGEKPDPAGVVVDVYKEPWDNGCDAGFEVDLTKLPKDVTRLRFWNSW